MTGLTKCYQMMKRHVTQFSRVCAFLWLFTASAMAQEITAIDFNGDLIGKVIPDGKVVSFDNQLIGNVTADSLITDFDGAVIGGVVPQGIAIGNDNKPLGKVNNDGSVRLASGKVIAKVLPNGLVIDDYFNIMGAVLFPGLVYSDDGRTVGRLTGDGLYTNLQGQEIGFVSADGYAYRKIGNDYLIDGSLISSKMVVSLSGEFIGSVAPGGAVTDFDAATIGHIKANGYVYDENNRIIGSIVRSGYALDNLGKYIGMVTYNGEVVNRGTLVGHYRADGMIADPEGNIIGSMVDFAATATDLNGRYLGRIMPEAQIARSREVIGRAGPAHTVYAAEGALSGRLIQSGPVLDYRGGLRAHGLKNGSVILLEGTPAGYMINNFAYENSGRVIGATLSPMLAINSNNQSLGMAGIGGTVFDGEEKKTLTPFGYLFAADGSNSGRGFPLSSVYNLTGTPVAQIAPSGQMLNKNAAALGKLTQSGFSIDERNMILGKNLDFAYAVDANALPVGNLTFDNLLADKNQTAIAKVLPDNSVVSAADNRGVTMMPKIGTALVDNLALHVSGTLAGYAGAEGVVRDFSGAQLGRVTETGLVIDNFGLAFGGVAGYASVVDDKCRLLGVVTPRGDIRNFRETVMGRPLLNHQAVSETGTYLGHLVSPTAVIDFTGNTIGVISANGQVLNYNNEILGCIDKRGFLKSDAGAVIAHSLEFAPVMNFNHNIIGRSILNGQVVNEQNQFIGYTQATGNVNSKTGIPIGNLFKYQIAFSLDNKYLGRVDQSAAVLNGNNEVIARVDFEGNVVKDSRKIGYALYDLYIYDNNYEVIGYIIKDGTVLSFQNQNLGTLSRGFLIDRNGDVKGRGNRDFYIRDDSNLVLGELNLNGDLVDFSGKILGRLKSDGTIADETGRIIAAAKPLQYYSKTAVRQKVYDENGKLIGYVNEDGSVVDENGNVVGYVQNGKVVDKEGRQIGSLASEQLAYDENGNVIGRLLPDGSVVDLNGKIIGKVGENGEIVDANGNIIGSIVNPQKEEALAYDAAGNVIGRLLPDGSVVDFNGNVIGRVNANGDVVDSNGNVIGKADTSGLAFDKNGNVIGKVRPDGAVVDADGNVIGRINAKGEIVDASGNVIGKADTAGLAFDADGNVIGQVRPDGTVVDANGNVIGTLNEKGEVIDSAGKVIGHAKRPSWFKKGGSRLPQIGLSPEEKEMTEHYRKSLGIALTPDGEYLGDIMEDGRVVNKEGQVVGRRMPDGLVIDDEGTLIGVEESSRPSAEDMFIPAGTFGPGAAYGTGKGPGGNLGPGGGFGPGERYDPQRAAALDAAQQERRGNMQVGKISSGISPDAFDGMQKNWDEQGVKKAISSWRVDLSEMIFADKPIPAVIARSIDSNNPTPVTAYVERNIYAEEGRNIIIPAGSRLMGTLGGLTGTSETTSQSAKVQISWERLIRPDGSMFAFAGITGDAQGRGGALGYLDQQLFKKYTLPIMTTALTSYTSYMMADGEESTGANETPKQQAANDARQNFLNEMNQIFEQILSDKTNIRPLTYVPAGTRIIVYPNVDLWMRTRDRNPTDLGGMGGKKDVFIDDPQVAGKRELTKNRRELGAGYAVGSSGGGGGSAGGNVVYQSEEIAVEPAGGAPALIDNSQNAAKKGAATPLISTPAAGSTPPPPPSFAPGSGAGTTAAPAAGSSAPANSSVPQLF